MPRRGRNQKSTVGVGKARLRIWPRDGSSANSYRLTALCCLAKLEFRLLANLFRVEWKGARMCLTDKLGRQTGCGGGKISTAGLQPYFGLARSVTLPAAQTCRPFRVQWKAYQLAVTVLSFNTSSHPYFACFLLCLIRTDHHLRSYHSHPASLFLSTQA